MWYLLVEYALSAHSKPANFFLLEKIYAFLLPSFWFTVFLFYLFEVSRLIFLRHLLEIESSRHNIAVRFTLCLWQELIWRCCSFIKMMENSFQGDHNLRKVMCGELFKEIISKIHVIRTRLNFPWTEIENRHRFQSCHTTWITIQDQIRESCQGTENSKTVSYQINRLKKYGGPFWSKLI